MFGEVDIIQNKGTKKERRITTEKRYANKWGWYSLIYDMAGGDILKLDAVTKTELYQALTFLSYKQDKFILEKEQHGAKQ